MYYKINAGPLAVDNGAVAPLNKLFQIASAAGTKVLTGNHYGDDYIAVPTNQSDKEAIEELLAEEKLLYKVVDKLPYYIVE